MPIGRRARIAIASGVAAAAVCMAAVWAMQHHYFSAQSLDAKPYPMRRIDLDFPPVQRGIEYYGRLRLDVFINAQGGVDRVEVLEARVPPAFLDAAVKAFSMARWEPGRKWWLRVGSVKGVEIDFEPPIRSLDAPLSQPDR